jgi:hypothetical protein
LTNSPAKPGRLGQAARRQFLIHGYYRRCCALADQIAEAERIVFQAREIARIERHAASAGIATGVVLMKEQVQDNPQVYLVQTLRRAMWPLRAAQRNFSPAIGHDLKNFAAAQVNFLQSISPEKRSHYASCVFPRKHEGNIPD